VEWEEKKAWQQALRTLNICLMDRGKGAREEDELLAQRVGENQEGGGRSSVAGCLLACPRPQVPSPALQNNHKKNKIK
jgi:hypothetical protein